MPPADSKKQLTSKQIELIRQWIKRKVFRLTAIGHLESSVRPSLPRIQNKRWAKNEIDFFIKAGLDHQRMKPSSQADKLTLIRRVSFDLRGLPPSIEEVNSFLQDESQQSYKRMLEHAEFRRSR